MFLKCQTKDGRNVQISLENIKEIESKPNSFIRITYTDGTITSLTYNPNSFGFQTTYTLDIKEINNLIHELKLSP